MKQDLVISLKGEEIDAGNAAALANKLSQMANGAVYGEDKRVFQIHDRKLDMLEDLIEAANGKPVLVAYWFKHDLERISERLHKRHIPFSLLDDSDSIRRWNSGELPVALIHPASAGHGLNLQAGGSTLVWFGLTWSLELYQQTNARLWRQGQAADTVVIHHIIAKDTIDERIMTALRKKKRPRPHSSMRSRPTWRDENGNLLYEPRKRYYSGGSERPSPCAAPFEEIPLGQGCRIRQKDCERFFAPAGFRRLLLWTVRC